MDKKKRIPAFVIIFLIGLFILNLLFFLRKKDNVYNSITGMFVKDISLGMNMSLIAFIVQWVILLLVVILAYAKFLKHRREEDQKIANFTIPQLKSKAETNLDLLYNLLKEKKVLNIRSVSKLFKVSKEKALEWAKILEDYDLATIEYPTFSDAEIRIKTDEIEK